MKRVVLLIGIFSCTLWSCSEKDLSLCDNETICETIVYPIPTDGPLNIQLKSDREAQLTVTVFDINGTNEFESNIEVVKGNNDVQLNLFLLSPGVYFLSIHEGEEKLEARRIIIR